VNDLGPEEKRKGAASEGSRVEQEGEGTMHTYAVVSLLNYSYHDKSTQ
jgi:hypothetical protein